MLRHLITPSKLFTEVCSSPSVTNGHAVDTGADYFKAGNNVSFSCNEGFTQLQSTTTCQATRVWSPPPVCTEITCKVPHLGNGDYTVRWSASRKTNEHEFHNTSTTSNAHNNTYLYNTTLVIKCNEGYELKGESATRTCQADGTWGQTPLVCVKILCNDNSDVRHEHIDHYPELAIGENGTVSYNSEHIFLSSGYTELTCSTSRKLQWIKAPQFGKRFKTSMYTKRCKIHSAYLT